ncbi:putative toxin-antitoxin system toxin component, PIN family [Thioalkalivibrio sp. XN279]|uniref:putative toxin-antitoxin system toxin component, PIN family n=1 Tax=Thioalkalivibrio sp. XN279 TaxID=2714953 RepID=UPI0014082E83|nr:putative toxin-antitoxin system toxin component, PIN family [Thioalkalivibrio sp. XN279]
MKVALDTNVLVSAFATRGLCADLFNLVLAEHELILGVTVLAESQRVLRQKMRIPVETTRELIAFLRREAMVVGKTPALPVVIRDASDGLVLAEAVAGGAEVLVTGDQDLLSIAADSPIEILSPRGLWLRLTAEAGRVRRPRT